MMHDEDDVTKFRIKSLEENSKDLIKTVNEIKETSIQMATKVDVIWKVLGTVAIAVVTAWAKLMGLI